MNDLLVLGGGVCGLGAADEALRQGATVTVVESEPQVGGLLRTDRVEGFCFDRGGHRFITSVPWVLERLCDLMGDRFLVRDRRSFVLLDGTRVAYPLEIRDLLRNLGPVRNGRALLSYLLTQFRGPRSEHTLADWLERRFGRYLYRTVFEGYSEKLWGVHPREISAEWAPQRISIPHLGGFLKELVFPSSRPPRTYARRFLYPRRGIGEIPEQLDESIRGRGGVVMTDARVVGLERDQERWVARVKTGGEMRSVRARNVLSTIPLPALHAALQVPDKPAAPEVIARGLRFLNLGFDEPVAVDATWIYHPDPNSRFTRIQVPAARSPWMVPEGCGSIQLEEPFDPGSGEDDSFGLRCQEARELLAATGLMDRTPTVAFETVEPWAYPSYQGVARRQAAGFAEWVASHPGILTAGRQGRFSFIFLDRALVEGVDGCRKLLGLEALTPPGESEVVARPLTIEARSLVEELPQGESAMAGHDHGQL